MPNMLYTIYFLSPQHYILIQSVKNICTRNDDNMYYYYSPHLDK